MTSVCTLPEGGSITVGIGDSTRTFRGGDRIDMDAVAVPAKGDRQAQTWRDALVEHAAAFAADVALASTDTVRQLAAELPKRATAASAKE